MLNFSDYNCIHRKSNSYKNTYYDLIKKTHQDLENLIRCFEIYLDDCVHRMPVACYSPDIRELKINSILSFNYTTIPTDVYPSLSDIHLHQIHGFAKANRIAINNNMVLGVNEYWPGAEKDSHTNFNAYKKFVQRIIKETGIDYKKVLERICAEHSNIRGIYEKRNTKVPNNNHVYIFGHSLDVTDGDILREIILNPGVDTTIFYLDKQKQADQIANLCKVLGQDELLKRVFSTSPTIIFRQQAKMASWQTT